MHLFLFMRSCFFDFTCLLASPTLADISPSPTPLQYSLGGLKLSVEIRLRYQTIPIEHSRWNHNHLNLDVSPRGLEHGSLQMHCPAAHLELG